MNIFISNDDGINAPGIKKLAEIASHLGDVYVVGPSSNRSAVSHGITIGKDISAWKIDFDVDVKEAYSVDGTPADCVRVGLHSLVSVQPDIILSGINNGYNLGFDTLYSGTVGAAREGNSYGYKSIAVSMEQGINYSVADKYLLDVLKDIIDRDGQADEVWNINLPNCNVEEVKGVKECILAPHSNFSEIYERHEVSENEYCIKIGWELRGNEDENTDINAISNNYIAVTRIKTFHS